MAASVDSTNTNTKGSGTSVALSLPGSAAAGDLLIAVIAKVQYGTVTLPSGWTEETGARGGNAGVAQLRFYWKYYAGGDATTWTDTLSNAWAGGILVVHSPISSSPIDASAAGSQSFTSTPAAPSVTPSGGLTDDLMITAFTAQARRTGTPPSGQNEEFDSPASAALTCIVNSQQLSSSSATGTKTETISAGDNSTGISVLIKSLPPAQTRAQTLVLPHAAIQRASLR